MRKPASLLAVLVFLALFAIRSSAQGLSAEAGIGALALRDFLGVDVPADTAWSVSTMEKEGMDASRILEGLRELQKKGYEIHTILLAKSGKLVLELYGQDRSSFPPRQLTPADKQSLFSVTKSFTSALIGIAIAEGDLSGADARVVSFFTGETVAHPSPEKDAMTLADLLSMRSGLRYAEGPDNALLATKGNTAAAILGLPLAARPGALWNYSTGNAQILAEILRRATKMPVAEFAQEHLFSPLGIRDYAWDADFSGTQFGGFGLSMRPRDMAKFGWLYLQKGLWDNQTLVPESWVRDSTSPKTSTPWPAGQYGWHWWVPTLGGFAARGFQGKEIYVFPDLDLVAVYTGKIDNREADHVWDEFTRNYILPAVEIRHN